MTEKKNMKKSSKLISIILISCISLFFATNAWCLTKEEEQKLLQSVATNVDLWNRVNHRVDFLDNLDETFGTNETPGRNIGFDRTYRPDEIDLDRLTYRELYDAVINAGEFRISIETINALISNFPELAPQLFAIARDSGRANIGTYEAYMIALAMNNNFPEAKKVFAMCIEAGQFNYFTGCVYIMIAVKAGEFKEAKRVFHMIGFGKIYRDVEAYGFLRMMQKHSYSIGMSKSCFILARDSRVLELIRESNINIETINMLIRSFPVYAKRLFEIAREERIVNLGTRGAYIVATANTGRFTEATEVTDTTEAFRIIENLYSRVTRSAYLDVIRCAYIIGALSAGHFDKAIEEARKYFGESNSEVIKMGRAKELETIYIRSANIYFNFLTQHGRIQEAARLLSRQYCCDTANLFRILPKECMSLLAGRGFTPFMWKANPDGIGIYVRTYNFTGFSAGLSIIAAHASMMGRVEEESMIGIIVGRRTDDLYEETVRGVELFVEQAGRTVIISPDDGRGILFLQGAYDPAGFSSVRLSYTPNPADGERHWNIYQDSQNEVTDGGSEGENIINESREMAEQEERIGPRHVDGWVFQDVRPNGNCFYESGADQLRRFYASNSVVTSLPEGTELHDRLRLMTEEEDFSDHTDVDYPEIINFALELNAVVAIFDTRYPGLGFMYHYIDENSRYQYTTNLEDITMGDRMILRFGYTGNHYMSVVSSPLDSPDELYPLPLFSVLGCNTM